MSEHAEPQLALDQVVVGSRFRRHIGDVDDLAASMKSVGLLHPVVVSKEGHLIAGRRRLEAAKKLGWTEIPVRVVDLREPKLGEIDENRYRRDLRPSEKVAVRDYLLEREKEEAKKRQKEGGKAGGEASGKFPEASKGQTRDRVAAFTGVSGKTLEKAAVVVEKARKDPERFGKFLEEMDRTGKVDSAYRAVVGPKKRVVVKAPANEDRAAHSMDLPVSLARTAESSHARPVELPTGPFDVVVVPPEWIRWKDAGHEVAVELQVPRVVKPEGAVFIWSTNARIADAVDLVRSWNLSIATVIVWVRKDFDPKRDTGDRTMLCVVAKASAESPSPIRKTDTFILAPASADGGIPDEFMRDVEKFGKGERRRLLLFAESDVPGWTSWRPEEVAPVAAGAGETLAEPSTGASASAS